MCESSSVFITRFDNLVLYPRTHNTMDILNFLKGKKTYIIGVLMIALGLLQGNSGMVLEGVAVMTLRAGIAKI
jgi:hypothetical protein